MKAFCLLRRRYHVITAYLKFLVDLRLKPYHYPNFSCFANFTMKTL